MSTEEDEDWFDATALGSDYEVQTSYSGKWRHRLRRPSDHEWIDGPPPTLTADPQ